MPQRIRRTNPHLRAQLQHAIQQIKRHLLHRRKNQPQILRSIDMKVRLVLGKLRNTRPRPLGRGPHEAKYLLQLVLVRRPRKQRTARVHLRHDTPRAPDIDRRIVRARPEEHVRRAVPQRHDFIGEGVNRDAEGAGEAEVGELELALLVDEQVLRLQVPVQHAVLVAEGDAPEELVGEGFDGRGVELGVVAARVHVAF